jgi:hypothetical protein
MSTSTGSPTGAALALKMRPITAFGRARTLRNHMAAYMKQRRGRVESEGAFLPKKEAQPSPAGASSIIPREIPVVS